MRFLTVDLKGPCGILNDKVGTGGSSLELRSKLAEKFQRLMEDRHVLRKFIFPWALATSPYHLPIRTKDKSSRLPLTRSEGNWSDAEALHEWGIGYSASEPLGGGSSCDSVSLQMLDGAPTEAACGLPWV